MCETAFRLCVLRDRFQTCPFLFFLSLPPGGKVPPEGADEGTGSRLLSCRGGTSGPPVLQQAHSTLIPNICIQTSHKRQNPSLFEQPQSLPPTGGRLPLSRGRFPLSGGNGRRPKGVGMLSRRDRGDRDRCPSAHTGADEGAFRPQMHVPAPLSQPSADSSPVKGRAMVPLQSI